MIRLFYEQPSLKKYGTMKDVTFAAAGSGGDANGQQNGDTRNSRVGDDKLLADTNDQGFNQSLAKNNNNDITIIGDFGK